MSPNVLKLDEVFGLSNPVIVEWKGRRYEMLRPEGLTLEQNNEWHKLSKKLLQSYGPAAQRVGKTGHDQPAGSMDDLNAAMNECLEMVCPSIMLEEKPLTLTEKIQRKLHPERFEERVPLSFSQKLKILEFYTQEVFPKRTGKAGQNTPKN